MELEIKKKYFGIYKNEVIKIEVVRKNKTSYSIVINDNEKNTLYFNDKGFHLKETSYGWNHKSYLTNEVLKIVTSKEASLFNINKDIKTCDYKIDNIQNKIDGLKNELENLEQEKQEILKRKKMYEEKIEKVKEGCD